jgi:heme ABC exporter ATP-binding subunit CcmA
VNSADPIVEMRDVSVLVGSTQILRRVDLDIAAGEAVGLFGGNGAGKTTLLRVLATLLRPDGGRAVVLDADLATAERLDVRHRIGLIGHTPALYPELTLAENLGFAAEIAGIPVAAVAAALATVGLAGAADREAAVCSYGMQRRAEYARELMLQPDLLLLDEPHSALDTASAELVAHLTDEVVARGGAAVLVSHDRDRVEKLVDRSLELSGGTVT